MSKIMSMNKNRREFLQRLGAMAGIALVPGLATEEAHAIPVTTTGAPAKKKAAPKKKVATKKKAAPIKKAAPKKKRVSVPEPSTVSLMSAGVAAIALAHRYKKKSKNDKD